jgi:hypothetical protein
LLDPLKKYAAVRGEREIRVVKGGFVRDNVRRRRGFI